MGRSRSSSPAPSARVVLGLPVLPPAAASTMANRLRAGVWRAHQAMGPPPLQILEGLFGILDHRVLVALCEVGVPDELDGPMSMAQLAVRTGADAERLERLVRFGATRGWLRIDRRGRVRPTRVTRFLRADHPGGWRAWVEFAGGDEVVTAIGGMTAAPASDDTFAAAHGRPFFEWLAEHPERGAVFDQAMAAGARMHALTLAATFDWVDMANLCDVGGGTGTLLATLLDLVPHLRGTLVDRPDVIARAVEHPRMITKAGDAFVEVPPGFDTYLLVNVLHDWNDADATRILTCVAAALDDPSQRLLVVDNQHTPVPRRDLSTATDVLMAVVTPGGCERDTAAFTTLARAAGLTLTATTHLASGDVTHELHLAAER